MNSEYYKLFINTVSIMVLSAVYYLSNKTIKAYLHTETHRLTNSQARRHKQLRITPCTMQCTTNCNHLIFADKGVFSGWNRFLTSNSSNWRLHILKHVVLHLVCVDQCICVLYLLIDVSAVSCCCYLVLHIPQPCIMQSPELVFTHRMINSQNL